MKHFSLTRVLGNRARWQGYENAVYGIADYLALPVGMLLAAPFLLRHLGAAQYGIWILAASAVSSGGTVSGSFGDAAIKYVGECRGRQDWFGVRQIVRNMLAINLSLSSILATVLWFIAPYVTRHIVTADRELQGVCLTSLRIGSGLLLIKSVDNVFTSTLRAFETYGSTVRIAICSRIVILISAIILAGYSCTVVWIMTATMVISASGVLAQALALRDKIGRFSPVPLWNRKTIVNVASFGMFSWLQAIASMAFGQADRFFVGFMMGAPAVAYYGLCVQVAQPIHGLIASGMHFLFPHLSARFAVVPISEIRRKVVLAIKFNVLLVGALSLPVILFGKQILTMWLGTAFARQPSSLFATIAFSFALLGMNVTAHYALLAVGQVRVVTYLNLFAGAAMLFLMLLLIPGHGLQGAALARLIYGPITCVAYVKLYAVIWRVKPCSLISHHQTYEVTAGNAE
jgi:O-antigen/teichoic acid export membrane protein